MKVMIVADEANIRDMLEAMIKEWGYEIAVAANGEKAWKTLRKESNPVIVVIDGLMSGKSGLDLCAQLKNERPTLQTYSIIITAKSGKEDITRGLDAGADDYIARPVIAAELRNRLAVGRRVLEYQSALDNLTHELQAKNQELTRLVTVDGLTGIASRTSFDERLADEWRRAQREGALLSLIVLDIDFFKAYNDTYGHLAGDECLKKVAQIISATIGRAGDLAARYGGEEFVVVLPNTDSLGTLVVAEAIRVAVAARRIEHKASTIHRYITVSVGTATIAPTEGLTPEALIAQADQALYQAKISGRNHVRQAT